MDPSNRAGRCGGLTGAASSFHQTVSRSPPDGPYLYWQAVKGKTLYRIVTEALHKLELHPDQVAVHVERIGEMALPGTQASTQARDLPKPLKRPERKKPAEH